MYMTPLDAAKKHTRDSLPSSMGKNVLRHIKGDQVLGKHRGKVFVFGCCFFLFVCFLLWRDIGKLYESSGI